MDRPSLLSLPFQASSKEAAGFFQAPSSEKAGCFQASSNETGCLFSVSSDETEGCFQAESSEMGAKVAGAFSAAGWVGRGSNRAGFVFSSGKKRKEAYLVIPRVLTPPSPSNNMNTQSTSTYTHYAHQLTAILGTTSKLTVSKQGKKLRKPPSPMMKG